MAQVYTGDLAKEFVRWGNPIADIYGPVMWAGRVYKTITVIETEGEQRARKRKGQKAAALAWRVKGTRGLRYRLVAYYIEPHNHELAEKPIVGKFYKTFDGAKAALASVGLTVQ